MDRTELVLKTIEKMDTKELRACFRASFRIKALEAWRPTIEAKLLSRGIQPKVLVKLSAAA